MLGKNHYNLFGFKLKEELQEIYLVEFLRFLSIQLVSLFLPIYLYKNTDYGLSAVFIFSLGTSLAALVFVPIAAELISRKGLRLSMLIGAFCHILLYASIALIEIHPLFFWIMIIMGTLKNSFWFIGENTDIAIQASKGEAATKMSIFGVINSFVNIISPLFAAFIITNIGFGSLYLISIGLAIITFVLTFLLGETKYEDYNFPSIKIFLRTLKNSTVTSRTMINILYGFRGTITFFAWPLLLYIIISDINSIGWLTTLILLTMTVLSIRISKTIDRNPHKVDKFLYRGLLVEGLSWLGKIGPLNFYSLFATDTVTQVSNQFVLNSLNKINFGNSTKEIIALEDITEREIAINIGQALSSIIIILLSIFLSDLWTLRISIAVLAIFTIIAGFIPRFVDQNKV